MNWSFSVEKVKANQYKVRLVAKIPPGYHIFSLTQPEDAIAMPTKITLNNNPDIAAPGVFKEEGELEKIKDPTLDIGAWQFSDKVDFTAIVTLKNNKSRTTLSGQVEFQVCNDDQCYPPAKVSFSLPLNH